MMRPSPAFAAACAALTAAVAGCGPTATSGGGKFSGQAKQVAQTVTDLATAGRKRDAKAVCTQLLASALVRQLNATRQGCQGAVHDQLKDADTSSLTVRSVKVNGNRATAVVRSQAQGRNQDVRLSFVQEDGSWRIAGRGSS